MAGVKGRSGGRNAKSVAQHKLEGTFDASRHAGYENPEPAKGTPTPPRPLAGHAKAEWDRMVARLEQSKTLALVDDAALYQYVQLFAEVEDTVSDRDRVQQLSADLMATAVGKLKGTDLVEAVAKVVELEYVLAKQKTQLRQGHMALKQMLVEFGMTPASRSRVRVIGEDDDKPKKSPLADLQHKSRVLRFGA